MLERSCNGCALCCKLLDVQPFNSPAGEWCKFCTTQSCAIFGQLDRERFCGPYKCLWLADDSIPEHIRPDRCHIVLEKADERNILVFVDPTYPDVWKEGDIKDIVLSLLADDYAIIVGVGEQRHVLLPEGRMSDEVLAELHSTLAKVTK